MMPRPTLIHDYLTITAQQYAQKPFLVCGDQSYTFGEIDARSTSLAHRLIERGIGPQDKVAILLDNSAETVISLYAASKAAAVFIVINGAVKPAKLRHILNNSQAKVLITHNAKGRVVLQALKILDQKPSVIWASPHGKVSTALSKAAPSYNWNDIITETPGCNADSLPRANPTDLAALIYTSGSTGEPKGVMQPHDKMIAVAQSIIQYLENDSSDVILNVLSLAFGYGLYQVLMAAMFGGTVLLEKGFVYLHDTLKKIAQHNVTAMPVVPTVLAMMFKLKNLQDYDFSSLKYITNAGDALPLHHTALLRKLAPDAKIYPMYGLTECVRVSFLSPELIDQHPSSVGREIPNCTAFVVDENGNKVAPDQIGELVITGDNVMNGYYRDPEHTAEVFRNAPDGSVRLYTGDLFKRSKEGLLFFISRKNDMIKSRGERVSPLEVQNILLDIEGVAEAAVIGVPDDMFGQAVKAFIAPADGHSLTEEMILKNCTENMENYMVPKYIEFMPTLPKTPNGKVDKRELKKREA